MKPLWHRALEARARSRRAAAWRARVVKGPMRRIVGVSNVGVFLECGHHRLLGEARRFSDVLACGHCR